MALRVLKFGGTSVETPERILAVARRIRRYRENGDDIIVVVSAMGQSTDELVHLAHRVCRTPPRREMDMLLTAGERISMALLAMALESLGCQAISFTGSQSGILTDVHHSDARILDIRPFRIEDEIAKRKVVIVAGFQGVSAAKEVTTLGRGGSDTTAVALAIRFGATCCEIFTDVDGVLSADPRIVVHARPLHRLDYVPMIALSHFGGRVLFQRAVRLARKYGMPIWVRNAHHDRAATEITSETQTGLDSGPGREGSTTMESEGILGIALESPVIWVRVRLAKGSELAAPPGVRAESSQGARTADPGSGPPSNSRTDPGSVFSEGPVPSTLLMSRTSFPDGTTWLQWIARTEEAERAWSNPSHWPEGTTVHLQPGGALLTLVGECAYLGAETLARAETALSELGVEIWSSQTSAHALSFLIPEGRSEEATRHLHAVFLESGLERESLPPR